ncbi:MAG: response regulator [Bacteroidota bacterium]
MDKINIAVADDHKLFRNGIEALLQDDDRFHVNGGVDNRKALLDLLKKHDTDIVLLDISLPNESGLDILTDIQEHFPNIKCIMLTMHEEIHYVKESLKKGAYGYLLKDSGEQELKSAIIGVFEGKKHFKDKISDLLVEDMSRPTDVNPILSEREVQIVKMVAEGKITKEIADKLFISVRTVETHRSRIMKKLGASNASEMVNAAYKRKLI